MECFGWLLQATCDLNFENSVIGNYYHCSARVVVANKGLHPTKFTNPPLLYKTKNNIIILLVY